MLASLVAERLGIGQGGQHRRRSGSVASGGDGTAERPFAWIQRGLYEAQFDDTVQVTSGEYREALRSVGSGTADARIRLVGEGARIIGGDDVHHPGRAAPQPLGAARSRTDRRRACWSGCSRSPACAGPATASRNHWVGPAGTVEGIDEGPVDPDRYDPARPCDGLARTTWCGSRRCTAGSPTQRRRRRRGGRHDVNRLDPRVMTDTGQLPDRRSALLVPGDAQAQLRGAARFATGQVVVDLAGLGDDRKAAAPSVAASVLLDADFGERLVAVRINPIDVPWAYRDVVDVVEQAGELIDAIVIPQVAGPDDLVFIDTLLGMIEQRLDAEHPIAIEAEIADAGAFALRDQIAVASDRLVALVVDLVGVATSLGAPDPTGAPERWQPVLLDVLATARAAGLQAIVDASELRDKDAYRAALAPARSLGFDGAWCTHPVQVDLANAVFV